MPPRVAPNTRSRGRPPTRALADVPAQVTPEEEVIDRDGDTEDDPDWDSEAFDDDDVQEAREEHIGVPPAPAMPQMPYGDPRQFYPYMFQTMPAHMYQPPVHTDYLALALPHKPPTFSGGVDPVVLDDWTYKMTCIFRHIGCPENRKVEVAVQFLDGPTL